MKSAKPEDIKYDVNGLVPVTVQDIDSAEVLMTAYCNREALESTLQSGEMVFYSRSRREIWHKGLTSGNRLSLVSLRIDCDGDALLAQVRPAGPACHTGERSCFFRTIHGSDDESPVFIGQLWSYLSKRIEASSEESYTARLVKGPIGRAAQKIGEEGVETALALASRDGAQIVYEAADLVYHLMVGLLASSISPGEIWKELRKRHEKAEP